MTGMKWHYLLIKVGQSGFVSCKMSKSKLKKIYPLGSRMYKAAMTLYRILNLWTR